MPSYSVTSAVQCKLGNWQNQIPVLLQGGGDKIAQDLLHTMMEPFHLAICLRMVCGGSIMLHTKCSK